MLATGGGGRVSTPAASPFDFRAQASAYSPAQFGQPFPFFKRAYLVGSLLCAAAVVRLGQAAGCSGLALVRSPLGPGEMLALGLAAALIRSRCGASDCLVVGGGSGIVVHRFGPCDARLPCRGWASASALPFFFCSRRVPPRWWPLSVWLPTLPGALALSLLRLP